MRAESLKDLNEQQLAAVKTTEGPLLIIAGPGSGKTRTLVARTLYLIAEKNIPPENIMVSTFTEKAAKELVSRVSDSIIFLSSNLCYSIKATSYHFVLNFKRRSPFSFKIFSGSSHLI